MLMILPADHLLAAYCPMAAEARQQQAADCCPGTSGSSGNSATTDHAESGNPNSDRTTGESGAKNDCNSCTECACAFVPHSGNTGPSVRDANISQNLSDTPAASRSILYILSETVERPDPPRTPIPAPVPAYLANRVLLN